MGIPSYFSHIIKNYPNIIKNLYSLLSKNTKFHSMYMDCNSIIYDAFHAYDSANYTNESAVYSQIIDKVVANIEMYITLIKPSHVIYIAFDGVAPFAKMDQQRNRRYKTWYLSNITFDQENNHGSPTPLLNTAIITPGTKFMNLLSSRIAYHFNNMEQKYGVSKIVVTGSDEPGEGEHKMFQHMRDNSDIHHNVAVYGLDSDLIMLSIFHCLLFQNIFIFREAPEFMKSAIPVKPSKPNEPYFMDIGLLSSAILTEMQCGVADTQRIYDYVFLCFFLGNDFLPHFPSLNIRTHGIQTLLDTYRKFIGNYPDRFFIMRDTGKIAWRWVLLFIGELAKFEHGRLMEESGARDKFEKRNWLTTTAKEKEDAFNNIPIIYRAEEKYICPGEKFWEDRYYKTLFHDERSNDAFIKSVCMNYLEGLEWVYKYYTTGCPNWRWKYNYHYPPLLSDLHKFVPHFDTNLVPDLPANPFSPISQLAYVLPRVQLHLLPESVEHVLKTRYSRLYPEQYDFQWTYCRYFWEAHAVLPEISLATLDTFSSL